MHRLLPESIGASVLCSSRSRTWLHVCDLKIISVPGPSRRRSAPRNGDPGAGRPHRVRLGSRNAAGAEAVRRAGAGGGGDDRRGVADRAVASGSPDADVVLLVHQVGLTGGDS